MFRIGTKRVLNFAGSFSPRNIPGLSFWVRPESLSSVDGTAVSSWTDESGNGRNCTQATGSAQPIVKLNILNGKSIVRFDGVDDFIKTANFGLVQPENIYIVSTVSLDASDRMMDGLTGGSSMSVGNEGGTPGGRIDVDAGITGATITGIPAGFHVFSILFSGASSYARYDGANQVSGNAGTNNGGGIVLASFNGGSAVFAPIDIAEVLIYNRALNSVERSKVERYLGAKYRITVS